MNSQKLMTLGVMLVLVIFGSIFLGSAVGREDTGTSIMAVSVIVLIVVFVSLGQNIWILVPVFAIWSGRVPLLPLSFSVSNLAVGFACFAWFLSLATRRQAWTFRFTKMDWLLGLTLTLLAAGYFRNPVGVAAFSSGSNVGARPYVEVMIALIGYVMLASQKPKFSVVTSVPKWALISASVITVGGLIAFFVPGVGMYMYQFYTGFAPNVADMLDPTSKNEGVGRANFLLAFAIAASALAVASCYPLKMVMPRYWQFSLLFLIATVFALASGYRSALVAVGFYFIFGSWMWKRAAGLFSCLAVGIVAICMIIVVQQIIPFPERIQRTLSFLPGAWDQSVTDDADGTVDWRVEMWHVVLEGDSIKNWWVGDGFGFPRSELDYFGYLDATNTATPEQMAEYYIITGGLHSGPLSSAKFVGVIGFFLYMILAIMVAYRYVKLWRQVNRYGTSAQLRVAVGFFATLAAYVPVKFVLIYGAYANDLAPLILSAGLLRLMETACRDHFREVREAKDDAASMIPAQV